MNDHIVHMSNGRLEMDTPFSHVQSVVRNAIRHRGTGGIVIHMHGGLVNERSARETATRLTPDYQLANAFPIFFVWESGLLDTLRNNLTQVASEKFFRKVLKRVHSFVKRKAAKDAGMRSGGMLPPLDTISDDDALDEALDSGDARHLPPESRPPTDLLTPEERATFTAELMADAELAAIVQSIQAGLRTPTEVAVDEAMRSVAPVVASTTTLMDPAAIERLVGPRDPQTRGFIETAEVVRAIVMIAARVIKRIVTKRAHGIYTTIVEETLREFYLANVGGKIWAMMKQDTADSFAPDPVEFGGTAVLTELAAAMRGGGYPKITLVGHSTGAVYISHWLQAADALLPHELQFDVVLLAPASTGALMAETLNQHGHRIRGFRMFSMTDEHERSDRLVPVLYPRSLLYFVSGVVETTADTPVAGMQRFYDSARYEPGEFPDVDTARRFFGQGAHRVVWSVAQDGLGRNTASISHGDFDNDTATIASLRHILMSGF